MRLPALVSQVGRALASWPPGREAPLDRAYRAASTQSQEMAGWRPQFTSADSSVLPAKDLALARTQDLVRDDPHARAGVDRRVDLLIGAGVRLVASFDAEALGITDREVSRQVRRQIEREWRAFANGPGRWSDAARQVSLNGRFRQLARTWASNGEATAVLRWRKGRGGRYRTCLQAIDPTRLCNPNGEPEQERLRGGIEFDDMGAANAYHVRNAHIADSWLVGADAYTWTRIPRETAWGRPIFVHAFEPERENQSRGMTPFAALVQRLKMISRHADLEIANAAANALVIATMESNLPPEAAAQLVETGENSIHAKRIKHYKEHRPTVGGVRIPVLPVGDKLSMNSSPRQTTAFASFQTAFLRSIAAGLGISYEQLSMDWSQTNYSSARAALNEVWRAVRRDFAAFVEQVIMPVYVAFLEEAFARGYIKTPEGVPSFWDMPEAWCSSRWIGSPRGYVDPVKEAQGAAMRLDNLTSTLEAECAEQGLDFEDVLDQLEYERQELERRGLSRASLMGHNGGPKLYDEADDDRPDHKKRQAD